MQREFKILVAMCLVTCIFYFSINAMHVKYKGDDEKCNPFECLPSKIMSEILDLLHQGNPDIPVLYLKTSSSLVNFAQVDKKCHVVVLEYIKNGIINSLINFNNKYLNCKDVKDLVVACVVFKILAGIRKGLHKFCNTQYKKVCRFLKNNEVIKQGEIKRGGWNSCLRDNLYETVKSGNITFLIRAIAAGADVRTPINSLEELNRIELHRNCTALHIAVMENKGDEVIKVLISADSDVNATIDNPFFWHHGMTALHLAAYCNNGEVIHILVSAHADIDARDAQGMTALHVATRHNNVDASRILVEVGIKVPEVLVSCLQKMGIGVPENQIIYY